MAEERRNNASERLTRLEAGLEALTQSTSRLGEALSRAIEASDSRSENLTGEIFRKIDELNRSANSRIERVHTDSVERFEKHVRYNRPNWIGIIGAGCVVASVFGTLILFAVNASVNPVRSEIKSITKDEDRIERSLESHVEIDGHPAALIKLEGHDKGFAAQGIINEEIARRISKIETLIFDIGKVRFSDSDDRQDEALRQIEKQLDEVRAVQQWKVDSAGSRE
jgi:hypothetical protein